MSLRFERTMARLVARVSSVSLTFAIAAASVWACSDDDAATAPPPEADAASDTGSVPDAVVDGGTDAPTGAVGSLYRSGSRLRAVVDRAGGASRFVAFFDLVRNESCDMQGPPEAASCLPRLAEMLYDDAACTIPALARQPAPCAGEEAAKYAAVAAVTSDACSFVPRVEAMRQLGAPVAARDAYQRAGDGSCVLAPIIPDFLHHALGAPVALSDFAKATVVREDISPELSRTRYVGEDGSELVAGGLFDRRRNKVCNGARVGPGRLPTRAIVCATGRQAYAEDTSPVFTEGTCTTRAATAYGPASCPAPDIVVRDEAIDAGNPKPECMPGFATTLHAPGAPVASVFDRPGGGACTPKPPTGAATYLALGPALDPKSLPELEIALFGPLGRGRLSAMSHAGIPVDLGSLWDDVDKAECHAATFADGKRYCVTKTTVAGGIQHYKDAVCTQPILLANSCEAAPTFLMESSSSCAAQSVNGWNVGTTKLSVTQYWSKVGDTCNGPNAIGSVIAAFDVLGQAAVSTRLMPVERVRE